MPRHEDGRPLRGHDTATPRTQDMPIRLAVEVSVQWAVETFASSLCILEVEVPEDVLQAAQAEAAELDGSFVGSARYSHCTATVENLREHLCSDPPTTHGETATWKQKG